jgi:hypothetical protein
MLALTLKLFANEKDMQGTLLSDQLQKALGTIVKKMFSFSQLLVLAVVARILRGFPIHPLLISQRGRALPLLLWTARLA